MKMIGVCLLNVYIFVYLTKVSLSLFLSLFLSLSLTHSLVPSSVKRRCVEKLRGAAKAIAFFGGKPACNISHIETSGTSLHGIFLFFHHQRQEAQNNRSIASLAQIDEDFFVDAFCDTFSRTCRKTSRHREKLVRCRWRELGINLRYLFYYFSYIPRFSRTSSTSGARR